MREARPIGSHYVRRTNSDVVIVFVHGIFGDAVSTWTNETTHAYWPSLLTTDEAFKDTDVYVHSFASPYLGASYSIDELVENMRLVFDNDEVFQRHKQVVFVAHSMGGIIVRGYLRRYQDRARQVSLMFLYATPTSGSQVTQLAQLLSRNRQIAGMLPAGTGTYVSILQKDWRAMPVHVFSRCAYELRKTDGIRIVDETSATMLCDGPVDPIDTNHIDIVKPKDSKALVHLALREAFQTAMQRVSVARDEVHRSMLPEVKASAIIASRTLKVHCGQEMDATEEIAVPGGLNQSQNVSDAVVSLQKARNLKDHKVELVGRTAATASVHYHLSGLDKQSNVNCPEDGGAIIVIAFLVSQMVPQVQTTIHQETKGDMSPNVFGVQGSVTIVRGVDPSEAIQPKTDRSDRAVRMNPLELATNPAFHGLLLEQITTGKFSPTIAGVNGDVVLIDSVKR